MNTEHLAIFINLAETLSFSRTALNMGVSQSAVSQTISSMEKFLGADLFYRTRKKVSLTPVGEAFYKDIKPIHHGYLDTIRRLEQMSAESKSKIRVGISGTMYEVAGLSQAISSYSAENPDVQFLIEQHNYHELVTKLNEGMLDLIFLHKDTIANQANINFKPLLAGTYAVAFKKGAFKGSDKLQISDLAGQRVVFLEDSIASPSLFALQKSLWQKVRDLQIVSANSMPSAFLSIQSGMALGILPSTALPLDPELTVLPLEGAGKAAEYGCAIQARTMSTVAIDFQGWLEAGKMAPVHELG